MQLLDQTQQRSVLLVQVALLGQQGLTLQQQVLFALGVDLMQEWRGVGGIQLGQQIRPEAVQEVSLLGLLLFLAGEVIELHSVKRVPSN